jgi:hypothetical protein
MNLGIRSRLARSRAWVSGSSAIRRSRVAISRTVVSCPAANRLEAIRAASSGSGVLRQVLAVLVDELGDVVAFGPDREQLHRVRARHDGGGGEDIRCAQHGDRFLVTRHQNDSVMRFPVDGPVLRQVVEVAVGIERQQRVLEVIQAVDVHDRYSFAPRRDPR